MILQVQPPLVDLLRPLDGVTEIIAKGDALPPVDAHCPLMSLPRAFKTNAHNTPAAIPYIHSTAAKREYWQHVLGPRTRPRIGISWSGNPNQKNDHNRSLPLADFVKALPQGCDIISLQKDVRDTDRATLRARTDIRDVSANLNDFADTAALCDLMDVVISIDTSVSHLAGAMGKDVRILLHTIADWRYYLSRSDSPWYPTAKLYRQPRLGDWDGAFANVKADLKTLFAIKA